MMMMMMMMMICIENSVHVVRNYGVVTNELDYEIVVSEWVQTTVALWRSFSNEFSRDVLAALSFQYSLNNSTYDILLRRFWY